MNRSQDKWKKSKEKGLKRRERRVKGMGSSQDGREKRGIKTENDKEKKPGGMKERERVLKD